MNNISIKKVTSEDIKLLQQIGKQTFHETFAEMNTAEDMNRYLTDRFSLERLAAELQDENSEFYFANDNNIPIGYLKINKGVAQTEIKDNNAVEIERIYVLKEYHGKSVGQQLYNKAIEYAKELDANYIWLGVWEENPRAINFYEKNGFKEFGRHIFKLGNDEQTDIMMKLELK